MEKRNSFGDSYDILKRRDSGRKAHDATVINKNMNGITKVLNPSPTAK